MHERKPSDLLRDVALGFAIGFILLIVLELAIAFLFYP
jgi:hypothetical protein